MPPRKPSSDDNSALSTRQQPRGCSAGCVAWPFAILFLGAGVAMFCGMALWPWWGMLNARNWVETPCTVVSSEAKANDDTLKLTVVFKYSVDQKEYQSDTYCFSTMSSNTANTWKRRVVKDHPPGKQTTCFVDPNDPARAVIERGWVPDMWWGFFPIPFMLVGAGALLVALGVIKPTAFTARSTASNWKPSPRAHAPTRQDDADSESDEADEETSTSEGPVTLEASSSPLVSFFVVLFIALFWNGIVSVFLWQTYQQFQNGGIAALNWFMVLFLTPFVLVGLGLIAGVFYTLLAIFNPKPTLTVNSQSIPLGEELQVRWTVAGRVSSITRFTISLKGVEKATYQRGTTTTTDEATFADILIVETFEEFEILEGSAAVTIPADTMHSFAAARNKIEWSLIVKGDISLWPDMSASFPITLLPKLAKESA